MRDFFFTDPHQQHKETSMKKHLIALAATAAVALPALAQSPSGSSVTLYGIADASLVRTNNVGGSGRTGLDSGYLQSSRFGFRGSEDLGGGLRAIFTLESGYNIDNGANSSAIFFNRQSFVGLSSSNLGTLRWVASTPPSMTI